MAVAKRWPLDQLDFHDIADFEMQVSPHLIFIALKLQSGETVRIQAQHAVTERGFTVSLDTTPPKRLVP